MTTEDQANYIDPNLPPLLRDEDQVGFEEPEEEIPADQREQAYQILLERLLGGTPLSSEELQLLAYGILRDPDVDIGNVQEIFDQLGDSPQSDAFEQAIAASDAIKPDIVAETIINTIATAGVLGVASGSAAAGRGILARGTANVIETGGKLGLGTGGKGMGVGTAAMVRATGETALTATRSSLTRNLVARIINAPLRKKLLWGAGVGIGGSSVLGAYLNAQDASNVQAREGTAPTTGGTTPDGTAPDWMDSGRPSWASWRGPIQPASPRNQRSNRRQPLTALQELMQGYQVPAGTLPQDLIESSLALGTPEEDVQQIVAGQYEPYKKPNPLSMGFYTINPVYFPQGATAAGVPAAPPMTSTEQQEAMLLYKDLLNGGRGGAGFLEEDIQGGAAEILDPYKGNVRPGGTIINAAFTTYRGRTLLQHTLDAAKRYGVPAALLYGMIALESSYNPNAVGDNGDSFGLVQLNTPAHPEIPRSRALDPLFAIDWAAANLLRNFNNLGTWEAALMAHNNPSRAAEFASTGTVSNTSARQQILAYAANALNYAQQSGIGDQIFDFDALNAGAAGPAPRDMTASQINGLKAHVRDLWEAWMGPGPADETFLNQWANWLFYGSKGDDDLEQTIKKMSTGRWPSKPVDLTWTEWSLPYRGQMEFMLELPKMDNTDPLLQKVLNEPVEGRELELMIRNDDRWKSTENFRDQFASVAEQLGETFGFTAVR